MATWFIASKLSPFASSLLNSSPAAIPAIPTLAELQKHADSARSIIADSLPSMPALPGYSSPATSTKHPPPAVSISHSVRQPIRPWHNPTPSAAPPSYSVQDPIKHTDPDGQSVGKLKKGRIGWRRIQGQIPDEEVRPKSVGSRGYTGGQSRYDRMSEGQEDERADGKTFWEWITCK